MKYFYLNSKLLNSTLSFASEISLLLGLQVFDVSLVKDEPCTVRSDSKKIQVKVTSCGSGSFTCNDGQCVSINERCNQISNCRYNNNIYYY